MHKMRLIVSLGATFLLLSLVGVIVFQQLGVSRIQDRYKTPSPSSIHYGEASNLEIDQTDRFSDLNSVYGVLNSNTARILRELQEEENRVEKTLHFDRAIYFPPVKAFWEPNISVPMELTLVDGNKEASTATVKISSSIDTQNLTLNETAPGVFKGTMLAVGLRLNESATRADFSVKYGDEIVAQYNDTFSGRTITATALFQFPIYIMNEASSVFESWKLLDSEGVPLVNYGGQTGIQYNPVIICNYALTNYQMYLATGNSTFKQTFLVQANWLVRNAEQKGNFSVWEYEFNWPWSNYNATNPFVSALAQGEGLSVLTRAHVLTGNETYLDVAEGAMHSFEVDMDSGGVKYTDADGVWYEEIADTGARSGKVLNGFLFSLFGLYEYWFETHNNNGYALFSEGINTLSSNICRYDTGSWSYYDLLHFSQASSDYHKIHIKQLQIAYELTHTEIFLEYSNKFQSYIH